MKKITAIILVAAAFLSLSACGNQPSGTDSPQPSKQVEAPASTESSALPAAPADVSANSLEELNALVAKDTEDTIAALKAEWEGLSTDTVSYDKYKENKDKIESLYAKIQDNTAQLCIRLREYSLKYSQLITSSEKPNKDKYDDFDEMYDYIYDDARDEIYDEIYDVILDGMYDTFYDGILEDAYDVAPYQEWSEVRSDEYELWSDVRSEVYESWSDFGSDVYEFWSDMRSAVYGGDTEKSNKKMTKFQEDIQKLKS